MANENPEDTGNKLAGSQIKKTGGTEADIELSFDVQSLRTVREEFEKIKSSVDALRRNLPSVVGNVNAMGGGGQKGGVFGGGSPSANTNLKNPVGDYVANRQQVRELAAAGKGGSGGGIGDLAGKLSSGGGGGKLGIAASAIDMVTPYLKQGVAMMDNRIASGANYALSADRMSVLYQQMSGLSQNQVQHQYRQPLTNYRLGAGGINTLLGLQASTGINAAKQASSVEALRTISGYSLSAGDTANMLASLGRPETVNRMFMMTGQSLYGFGGTQNTGMGVVQNIVNTAGLTNKKLVDSAFQQGSVSRDRLRQMGVPEEMIDTVLQYARQNITYREKGGKGMYDPSSKAQRKRMGIEGNYATQAEETERVQGARDEQFYRRQADNYADMEKALQRVTKMLGAFEDKLSGIIGARAKTSPYKKGFGFLGGALSIVGAALAPFTAGTSLAFTAAGAAMKTMGDGAPDSAGRGGPARGTHRGTSAGSSPPGSGGSSGMVRFGSGSIPISELENALITKTKVSPELAKRLTSMAIANPEIAFGTGGGYRTDEKQLTEFKKRYKRSDDQTSSMSERKKMGGSHKDDRRWDGVWYDYVPGHGAPMAAPGMSLHQMKTGAEAFDLVFTGKSKQWAHDHAEEFGLWFPNLRNDDTHVEMVETKEKWGLKNDTSSGSPLGPSGDTTAGTTTSSSQFYYNSNPKNNTTTGTLPTASTAINTYSGQSIAEVFKSRQQKITGKLVTSTMSSGGIGGDGAPDMAVGRATSYNPLSFSGGAPTSSRGSTSGSTMVSHYGGDTYHIAPVIHMDNASNVTSSDVRSLAREVAKVLEQEIQTTALRRK